MPSPASFGDPAALQRALAEQLEPARVPGMVVAAARGAGPVVTFAYGADADGAPLSAESLFPVASVTKLATALAVLQLSDAGLLDIDEPLSMHLPDSAAARSDAALRDLLCHTAGLPLDLNSEAAPYAIGLSWPGLAQACLEAFPERPPGEIVQYSNIGYGLLGIVVERLTGQPFSQALAQLVLKPLGISATLGDEPPRRPARIADVRGAHAGSAIEPFNSPFWRSLGFPWGGLVTTAAGALALAQAFLGLPGDFLRAETRALATRSQTGELAGGFQPPLFWERCPWGLGPDIRGGKQPHWAPSGMPTSFGHSGASGCLAWADPVTGIAWAMLGTRTADSGWLVRRGPALSASIIAAVASSQ
jgi:CubicO group peptidase (beta-lactamase class C family)